MERVSEAVSDWVWARQFPRGLDTKRLAEVWAEVVI